MREMSVERLLVAELSSWLLGEGNRFCFLYSDLSNPTSNRIYTDIGYERVCESAEYGFDDRARRRQAGNRAR
jgi:predicted GNAT family acetyltransferase